MDTINIPLNNPLIWDEITLFFKEESDYKYNTCKPIPQEEY